MGVSGFVRTYSLGEKRVLTERTQPMAERSLY
jgi:hypothetical protein